MKLTVLAFRHVIRHYGQQFNICGVSVRKDIYVLDQFLKHLFDKHFNMGVINVPQSLANQLHLWTWHMGNQRFMIWLPCLFLQHSFLSKTQFLSTP